MADTRLSKGFPLRGFSKLGKYSDASESIYVLRQDRIGEKATVYYIALDKSFVSKAVMAAQNEPWIQPNVKRLLDSVGTNVDEMQRHDTHTTWWELAVDSDEAAFTLFILVVSALLKN